MLCWGEAARTVNHIPATLEVARSFASPTIDAAQTWEILFSKRQRDKEAEGNRPDTGAEKANNLNSYVCEKEEEGRRGTYLRHCVSWGVRVNEVKVPLDGVRDKQNCAK